MFDSDLTWVQSLQLLSIPGFTSDCSSCRRSSAEAWGRMQVGRFRLGSIQLHKMFPRWEHNIFFQAGWRSCEVGGAAGFREDRHGQRFLFNDIFGVAQRSHTLETLVIRRGHGGPCHAVGLCYRSRVTASPSYSWKWSQCQRPRLSAFTTTGRSVFSDDSYMVFKILKSVDMSLTFNLKTEQFWYLIMKKRRHLMKEWKKSGRFPNCRLLQLCKEQKLGC